MQNSIYPICTTLFNSDNREELATVGEKLFRTVTDFFLLSPTFPFCHQLSPTIINFPYCHQLLPTIIHFPLLSSTSPDCHQLLSTIINFPLLSSTSRYCHQLYPTVINFTLLSSTSPYYHQLPPTVIKDFLFGDAKMQMYVVCVKGVYV